MEPLPRGESEGIPSIALSVAKSERQSNAFLFLGLIKKKSGLETSEKKKNDSHESNV